ncbi:MAG: DUF1801 domain-containing protein [Gordonia amarae]
MGNRKTAADPDASVEDFLSTVGEQRRTESHALIATMSEITGEPAVMWGSAIIGFGVDDSGGSAWPRLAFSPRKTKISLYITSDAERLTPQLDAIGKYTIGKGCIYLNKLADVDSAALSELIARVYADKTTD